MQNDKHSKTYSQSYVRGEIGNLLSNIVRLLRRDLETYRKTLESAKAAD